MKTVFQNNHCIVFESEIYRTTTTLVYTDNTILLVDPNLLPGEVEQIRLAVNRLLGSRQLFLLFTHSDYDHILAYGAFPEGKVIASHAFAHEVDKAAAVEAIHKFDEEFYIKRTWPVRYPEVDIIIEKDETVLALDGLNFKCWLAPGHTACGLFTLVENFGIFIAGDYLSNIEFPFVYDSVEAYLQTMAKTETILSEHEVNILVPGHGDLAYGNAAIRQRKDESVDYLLFLKRAGKGQNLFAKGWIEQRYGFSRSLDKCHADNLALAIKEYHPAG